VTILYCKSNRNITITSATISFVINSIIFLYLSSQLTLVLIYHVIISYIILEQIQLCNINDNKMNKIIVIITVTSKIIIVTQSIVSIVYFVYLFVHTS
jgi:hypothetical protein